MQLDEFLYNLHFNIDAVRPVDVEVDWDDAPLPFKLYRDLPTVELPRPGLRSFPHRAASAHQSVSLEELSDLFWYSYGLAQVCHTTFDFGEAEDDPNFVQMVRRFVPSGGALYPSELYAYLHIDELETGVYHYDAAHHRLVLLRAGNFDDFLERGLGHSCRMTSCFGTLFVSTMFWKNFYKYNNFSYRLQGLDAGALIGQILAFTEQVEWGASVCYQFLDSAVNRLLGLWADEERVYAVIPLSLTEQGMSEAESDARGATLETAEALCSEIGELRHTHYVKSKRIVDYPMIKELNAASMLQSTEGFARFKQAVPLDDWGDCTAVPLPAVPSVHDDFTAACRRRFSAALDFMPRDFSIEQLSAVLQGVTELSAYRNDLLQDTQTSIPHIQVAACIHGIDGIPDGAYIYDAAAHALRLARPGDHRMPLQLGMTMPTVNLFQVPVVFHLTGQPEMYLSTFGYRGYRTLQMEIGILLQHLLLRMSALGLSGHPLLGYDEAVCDEIYGIGTDGRTCLIQLPAGHYRKRVRFEGMLFS